jgi:aminoglycoside phosphotransferase (APT) family kinase protein
MRPVAERGAISSALDETLGRGARIVRRQKHPSGAIGSEILVVSLPNGEELRLFYKRDDPDKKQDVAYEGRVYREVLEHLGLGLPKCYAAGCDQEGGWLLLDCVSGGKRRRNGLLDADAMALAARWLGTFHAACARRFDTPPQFLHRHDAAHYGRLAGEVLAVAPAAHIRWIAALDDRLGEFLDPLMQTATVVHDDFHLDNVVFSEGRAVPIDWEHAAVDLGEADLAFLCDGWDEEIEHRCVMEYAGARWAGDPPSDLQVRVKAAKLCLSLYEIAGWRDRTDGHRYEHSLAVLRQEADVLGLINGIA